MTDRIHWVAEQPDQAGPPPASSGAGFVRGPYYRAGSWYWVDNAGAEFPFAPASGTETVVDEAGLARTLASSDGSGSGAVNVIVRATSATGPVVFTIPADATDDMPVTSKFLILALAAGDITVDVSNITVDGTAPLLTSPTDGSLLVIKTGADRWAVLNGQSA